MAQRATAIFADQIDDIALGDGIKKNVSDDTIMQVAIKTSAGLKFDTAELAIEPADIAGEGLSDNGSDQLQINVDDVTVEIATDTLQVKDEGISEAKLDIYNAPSVGKALGYTANGLEWVDFPSSDAITETEYVVNEVPTGLINSLNVTYTLANTPVTGKEQVFLNGLLQNPGSGLDYTISGNTITFAKAPRTNSELLVSYIYSA